jgi:hypothetical protein
MKTVYETLPPTLQKRYDEIHRKAMDNALADMVTITHDGGLTWTSPQGGVAMSSNAPLKWDMDSRTTKWNKCQNKTVIDIGVIANGACITFDDSSMLQIIPSNSMTDLIEKTQLNFLNGTQLDDIVVVPHHSLVSDYIGNLIISGKNGAQVIFKIISPATSTNFYFELTLNGKD